MIEIQHKPCANGDIVVTVTDGDKVLGMFSYSDDDSSRSAMGLLSEVLFKLGYPSKFIWHRRQRNDD